MAEDLTLAEVKCAQRERPFPTLFRQQYVVGPAGDRVLPGFRAKALAGWQVQYGEALRVCELADAAGTPVGFVLGIALTDDSVLVEAAHRLDARLGDDGFIGAAGAEVEKWSGRYVVLLLAGQRPRLYGDPISDLSWVYDAGARRVASSTGLLIRGCPEPDPDFSVNGALRHGRAFGFGHTFDRRVRRGVTNHYLDLEDFTLHRHWPKPGAVFDTTEPDVDAALERIIALLSGHMSAYLRNFDCILPLTRGHDSRMLLTCALDDIDKVAEISTYRFHASSRADARMAHKITQSLGVPYKQYYFKQGNATQKRDFFLKDGWGASRQELRAIAMLERYPQDHLVLRGGGLEMMRANVWRLDRMRPHVPHGLRKMRVSTGGPVKETVERWGPAYHEWVAGLPEGTHGRIFDLAHVEYWLPNSLGCYYNGFHRNFFLDPFSDRDLIALAASLPVAERKSIGLIRRLIGKVKPELLAFQFH